MQILKASVLYFAIVLGAGFLFGTIRSLWVVPRMGTRLAESTEMPIMLLVTIVGPTPSPRFSLITANSSESRRSADSRQFADGLRGGTVALPLHRYEDIHGDVEERR